MLKSDIRGSSNRMSGFSLAELMVTVLIASVLFAVSAPTFSGWIQSTRVRNTAGDIFAGIQRAKAEAVQRNIQARFQLTTNLNANCALTTSGTAWVVSQIDAATPTQDATGKCNLQIDSAATTPRLLAVRAPDTSSVQVAASQSSLVFNSLGKQVNPPAGDITINVSYSGGTCADAGGKLTCLRIVVSPAGQARLCNPRFPAGDPQAC
ncbi:MAG TPA: GspH/FimT family pseudopilin [Burkholderiaceae bacterium]|jgi:type IV fimbrial biogenesis protein FimT